MSEDNKKKKDESSKKFEVEDKEKMLSDTKMADIFVDLSTPKNEEAKYLPAGETIVNGDALMKIMTYAAKIEQENLVLRNEAEDNINRASMITETIMDVEKKIKDTRTSTEKVNKNNEEVFEEVSERYAQLYATYEDTYKAYLSASESSVENKKDLIETKEKLVETLDTWKKDKKRDLIFAVVGWATVMCQSAYMIFTSLS